MKSAHKRQPSNLHISKVPRNLKNQRDKLLAIHQQKVTVENELMRPLSQYFDGGCLAKIEFTKLKEVATNLFYQIAYYRQIDIAVIKAIPYKELNKPAFAKKKHTEKNVRRILRRLANHVREQMKLLGKNILREDVQAALKMLEKLLWRVELNLNQCRN